MFGLSNWVDEVAITNEGKIVGGASLGGRSVLECEAADEFWVELRVEDVNLEAVSTWMVFKARKLNEIIRKVSVDRGGD